MHYAIDVNGAKFNASNAKKGTDYFCHACKCRVTLKQGKRVAHHFAHKPNDICDPAYHQRVKSEWHNEMQSLFPEEMREYIIRDDERNFRIADVLLKTATDRVVFEFQFSPISSKEFYERTMFYLRRGIKVIGIFNYATISNPKKIFYTASNLKQIFDVQIGKLNYRKAHFVWPGRDYVNIFDDYDIKKLFEYVGCNVDQKLSVFFYIFSFHGRMLEREYNGHPYVKWETDYGPWPLHLFIKPDFLDSIDLKEFDAKCFMESDFLEILSMNNENTLKLCAECWK